MNKYQYTKQWLKDQAVKIKKIKKEFKEAQRTYTLTWQLYREKNTSKREYRHRHIAYSLFRGRTMEQIEKPSPHNLPNMSHVNELLKELEDARAKEQEHEIEKIVCSCA